MELTLSRLVRGSKESRAACSPVSPLSHNLGSQGEGGQRQAKLGSTHLHRLAVSLLCGGVRVQVLAFVVNEVIMTGGRGSFVAVS